MLDPAACPEWDDPARTMLGAQQERWLDAALAGAGPGWTVIGQQTLFGRRDFRSGPGRSLWNDGWDGYGAARGRLTQSLQRHQVANPVLLGGDVHENWVGHVKADYERPDSAIDRRRVLRHQHHLAFRGQPADRADAWPRTRTSSSPTPSARVMASPNSRRNGSPPRCASSMT